MPTVRLRLANDEPLLIPAHSFRFMEKMLEASGPVHPDARALLLYDLGDSAGVQVVHLKTGPDVVAELVESDPRFMSRLVSFATAEDGRIWMLPQHHNGVAGYKPPSDAELAEISEQIGNVDAQIAGVGDGEEGPRTRVTLSQLRVSLEARRSFAGVHCKLNVLIPDRNGDRHYHYWLTDLADEVIEALEPTPKTPLRPHVASAPVREPLRRRQPRKTV